ncbi:class I SAM-dependent methyltransferase [Mollicutes bacterium LVI A0078]|nr:class I SAM-dependent methyltransferase [Mollicutes bacterium LVI A0075]WOO91446.1 class I SAM-dependent methyltransferase [Mollicutes bacterium LVI A0078]
MHYNYEYFKRTSKIDMTENYNFFLKYFKGRTILDLGCGSGRDSNYFRKQGYYVTSVDNSVYAMQYSKTEYNIDVTLIDIESRSEGIYDGIWSCASLVHMEQQQVLKVLNQLKNNLADEGVMYISLKYGEGHIENNNQLYYLYNESLKVDLTSLGYQVCDYKVTRNDNPLNNWIEFILKRK